VRLSNGVPGSVSIMKAYGEYMNNGVLDYSARYSNSVYIVT